MRTLSLFTLLAVAGLCQDRQPDPAYQAELERQWKAHPTLALGASAPDFDLPGVDGKRHTLAEYKGSILGVIFTCNHCPVAQLYEERIRQIVAEYGPKGVSFVAIQPNAVSAAAPREMNYTDVDDSLEGMIVRARHRQFNFPYLYDGDTQQVVHNYGPKVTPHVFLFDSDRKLRYEGRIDDHLRETEVKTRDMRDALDALLTGEPVAAPHTPVFGCSTKWKSQSERKQREKQEFEARPVTVESAGAGLLKQLRANPTGKTLLVNFWATWCGPCVEEFQDLLTTYLWYRSREFEVVTVSTNSPGDKAAVLKFLEQQHSGVRNLQFESDDIYALQAAFDPTWDSGVPFTMVIAPDGKVIYREEGEIHLLELRRAILAHLPDMGYPGNSAYWARP